ncbi:MAG: TetR/AcrR family transcriptional regulator [Gammaproteobacteria bacterium]|nr:TetR/AcrR family transcriptional regulator [Gammaproteobacteria bacterium]
MSNKATANRNRIVDIADQLFYSKGFNQSSFTDIAEAADIPRGNFYYYFKTKDEILESVIDKRLSYIKSKLAGYEAQYDSPQERILKFIEMFRDDAETLNLHGCPMGTLNMELSKTQHELRGMAKQMFDVYRNWLTEQFRALNTKSKPEELAMHLLVQTQGLAVMAQTYNDPELIKRETRELKRWVFSL